MHCVLERRAAHLKLKAKQAPIKQPQLLKRQGPLVRSHVVYIE